ncbi:TonB-dependent copper receptor [Oxalobacteraceae bacterium R-40]|uniref:TonB-dependent copper receptor n=1 Tax=Keguizhuia sedimenti TaxID=3064264 RepID=A0ABU1BWB4_9BURK|nr:TonB-dependent copper receptor [Oxalobacteraceae bacterium R-40]
MFKFAITPVACATAILCNAALAQTADNNSALPVNQAVAVLPEVVVTAEKMSAPLTVESDPKAPRQPVPAHDGADYLKTIPGFSVIRKAGTDGDPVLRGMAGSRLNILVDGQQILGGCGARMDPPTAYVFPETFDRITVLKGPQTVLYGPGNSAGTVLFERAVPRFTGNEVRADASATVASFGRKDGVAQAMYGNPNLYLRAGASRSEADDYLDGDGERVHSRYERWNTEAAIGITPDRNTVLELSAARSDGEAAYADRSMDGVKFERENIGFKFEKRNISPLVYKLEANIFRNYIDHVMDNYSLRTAGAMRMVSNPDRKTTGGRIAATLRPSAADQLVLGADIQENTHTLRTSMNQMAMPYQDKARTEDAEFRNAGIFGELTHQFQNDDRLIAGLRADRWHAKDSRAMVAMQANPTAGATRDETLESGFARFERDLKTMPLTLYAGLGHSERFPDYWEAISKESATSLSAFHTRPEKTDQLDIGAIYQSQKLHVSLSAFYGKVDDFILTQSNVAKGMRNVVIARNIDATTWGGELGVEYALSTRWKLDGSLSYVRGTNDSDDTPLAQIPPLETRFGLNYDDGTWSFGSLLRVVAKQDRFDLNKGNIVGQDLGSTPGFAVFSLNGGWKPRKEVLLSAGIDNLFDRTYAEHLSRSGAMVAGYTQTDRINEPGRTIWVKAQFALD